MRIIEYIGIQGIVSSDVGAARLLKPRVGDLILWPDGKHGMIESIDGKGLHVCSSNGSAFLGKDYVSISGGPFYTLERSEIEPAYGTSAAHFWNWCENGPGADQGVHFTIQRPVFEYIGDKDKIYDHKEEDNEL